MKLALIFIAFFIVGTVIGGVYLFSLWRTVNKLSNQDNTKMWFLGTAFVRVALIVAAFYFVSAGDFLRIVALLFGFMFVRYIGVKKIVKRIKTTVVKKDETELKEI